MKRIYGYILTIAAMAVSGTACQQEINNPDDLTPKIVEVKVTIDDPVKGFTDREGITWEVGDQIKYAGGVILTSEALQAEDISEDGYSASFKFPAALNEVNRTGWFVSTKCHPGNNDEVEFTLGQGTGHIYTQDVAGEMNKRYLFLHSGTGLVNITAGETPQINMSIVGTIFRFIPYTTQYNDESVMSVKLASNTNLVGTVAYDRGAGSYRGVNDINWQKSNFVTVNLGTAFSLEGVTSAETSNGIYMAVAATKEGEPLNGYQYVIETNKAVYTFDAMDKNVVVAENTVKNVPLNLDKAARSYDGGELQYIGDLNAASNAILSADGVTDFDGGYWYAQIKSEGSDEWVNKDGADNIQFYNAVEFTAVDAQTGESVDWVNVRYGGNGGSHWLITAAANTGDVRTAVVTATFPDVKGYLVTDECKTKSVTITQAASGSVKVITYYGNIPDTRLEGKAYTDHNIGYYLLEIDKVINREWNGLYSLAEFKCVSEEDFAAGNYENQVDWLTCEMANNNGVIYDAPWWITATANNTGAVRKAVIVCVYPEIEGYQFPEHRHVLITQDANTQILATLSDVYDSLVPATGSVITAASMQLTVNGEQVADVAAAISQYNVSVSVNNGASVDVSSDGTITLTVPENPYKNGGKEYVLTVKYDGETLASIKMTQEEGQTEGEEEAVKYDYEVICIPGWNPGTPIGFPTNFGAGHYFTIQNVKLDGVPVAIDDEIAAALIKQAFRNVDERPAVGYDHKAFATVDQIHVGVMNITGSTLMLFVRTSADSADTITRLEWLAPDGSVVGYIYAFV